MTISATKMADEISEISAAVQRLIDRSSPDIRKAAEALRRREPHVLCTIARGSSDHAAAYLKYAVELTAGIPVASIGPSVSSIYASDLKLERAASISVSQSGGSPDIVNATRSASRGGGLTIALTNNTGSDLAGICDFTIGIEAGPEMSVAATKTFVTSIVAGLLVLAHWRHDNKLLDAIERLPGQCRQAAACDWSPLAEQIGGLNSIYVLGRGPSMAIANEAALKFKETCQIQAESYSSAEVMHGPVSIVSGDFPVLALAARDPSEKAVVEIAEKLEDKGAMVFLTSQRSKSCRRLPFVASGHPLTDPLLLVVSFYVFVERLARQRGLDPDAPPNLRKVTETV